MHTDSVPAQLRERLGEAGTAGLVQLFNDVKTEWASEMIGVVGDRFERRLVEETSRLRVDMALGFASVRQEMAEGLAAVRQEMSRESGALRQEMARESAAMRQEMGKGFAAVREEMAQHRVELLKWAFLFWVGQGLCDGQPDGSPHPRAGTRRLSPISPQFLTRFAAVPGLHPDAAAPDAKPAQLRVGWTGRRTCSGPFPLRVEGRSSSSATVSFRIRPEHAGEHLAAAAEIALVHVHPAPRDRANQLAPLAG